MTWLPVETSVPPTENPVDIEAARFWLKVNGTGSDTLIEGLIRAATRYVENMTGLRLVTQTVIMKRDDFSDCMVLPVGPVQSITSVEYLDNNGASQSLDPANYSALLGQSGSISLVTGKSWPSVAISPQAVTITAVVGFGQAEDQPEDVRTALMMLATQWFDTRGASTERELKEAPLAVWSLLQPYRPLI